VFQVRIHGRGGQGVVTAAELLSVVAFDGGHHAQAFRASAPSATARRSSPSAGSTTIRSARASRSPAPDALIVQDPTLLHEADVLSGARADTYVLINSVRTFAG
jgi:pyruvate ferredoxin oxidoreductase gamma subunit